MFQQYASYMNDAPVLVLDYGVGNIHSILKALRKYLPNVIYSNKHEDIKRAKALVLPGDGAFSHAMAELQKSGQAQRLVDFATSGRPLLGICIGFQILFESSEEGNDLELAKDSHAKPSIGLGLIPGHIKKFSFSDNSRVPHMGWNRLHYVKKEQVSLPQDEYMYFIHSYRAMDVPEHLVVAYCRYGSDTFPAIVQKENILATQFHPEKSDKAGLRLIENWTKSLA